jgi:hypothetical protein
MPIGLQTFFQQVDRRLSADGGSAEGARGAALNAAI